MMPTGRIAAALILLVCWATHAANAYSCEPIAGSSGDPVASVPEGHFSIIMAPYQDDEIPPMTFLYGSEDELVMVTLGSLSPDVVEDQGPGDVLCWLKEKTIHIFAAESFLKWDDYKGTITHKGNTIQIDSDTQCQKDLCKKFTSDTGRTADTCHAVRCLLAV